jgi:hypothetical protein
VQIKSHSRSNGDFARAVSERQKLCYLVFN